VSIADESGKLVTLYNTARDEFGPVPAAAGEHMVKLVIPNNDFLSGKYYISVYLGDEIMMITYAKVEHALSYVIQTPRSKNGLPIAEGAFRSKHCWEILQ
jgi:lipopolysaccharide transport system ATP-binding protein/teichoic acid transport system ATP-binding protein